MKTFNENQMRDPWAWCLSIIEKHRLDGKLVAEAVGAPRSTMRALLNGNSKAPKYDLLLDVLSLCIDVETGEGRGAATLQAHKAKYEKAQILEPVKIDIEDFL